MKEKNMITDEMLVDYLLGEATIAETQQVEQWLNENETNREYFEQFKLIWENSTLALSPINENTAWANLQQRLVEEPARAKTYRFTNNWLKAAAILLLFISIGTLAYLFNTKNSAAPTNQVAVVPIPTTIQPKTEAPVKPAVQVEQQKTEVPKPVTKALIASTEKPVVKKKASTVPIAEDCKNKQFVCNNTSCPLQICIIQKSSCDKSKPYAISNCSIIQPDQSGQICYKVKDELFFRNCGLTVEEVRITRVSTGETIVLNAHSSPMTAQDFFNYITGKQKGEIVAGAFESDCDNVCNEHDLRIDNSYGGVLFR